ncbi:MAG: GNAT family N-acetyltransferase [Rhodobacterales bacterium]|nr:GNAT family N-acetyltransferase [Rhodobacterales bacterium]
MTDAVTVSPLDADGLAARLDDLGALLHACVLAGANVNFVLPFSVAQASAFWADKALPPARAGTRRLWVARDGDGAIVGTVMLGTDTPPNQPHRAEVSKLLVHPDARRRGIARALMAALEAEARRLGRTLLTLDTRTGDLAEPLYRSLGYVTVGVIPDFCLDPIEPGRLFGATFMYKVL